MANYNGIIDGNITSANQKITNQNTPDSITPVDVGSVITAFMESLRLPLNNINAFNILTGSVPPIDTQGNEDDVYVQGGSNITFYKKTNNTWVNKGSIALGINIVDGNINVKVRISGVTVTASAGQWGINNVIYQKAVQTQFTVSAPDANFDRIDAIFADNTGSIYYSLGTASSNPDNTKPTTPTNNVIIDYIYVPSLASGLPPYIADGESAPPGATLKDKLVTALGSDIGDYELDLSMQTDIPYPSTYTVFINGNQAQAQLNWDRTNNKITGFPFTAGEGQDDAVISVYFIGR